MPIGPETQKDITAIVNNVVQQVREEVKEDILVLGDKILGEVEKLRIQQTDLHEEGKGVGAGADPDVVAARDAELERIKLNVKREALSLLKLVGLSWDDLQAWKLKKEQEKRRRG